MSGGPSGSDEVFAEIGAAMAADIDGSTAAVRVRLPEQRRVVDTLGTSEVAKVLVATIADGPPAAPAYMHEAAVPLYEALPSRVRVWLEQCAERARWCAGAVVVDRKAGPRVDDGGGWLAEESRIVDTIAGPLPLTIATKAALRTKDERKGAAAEAGTRLEPVLLDRWAALPETEARYLRLRFQHGTAAAMKLALDDAFPEGALFDLPRVPALRHAAGPSLIDYADGFAWTWDGEVEVINGKCTWFPAEEVSAANWLQAQGELAVAHYATRVVLPHGQGWASKYGRGEPHTRPIETFFVERAPAVIARLYPFAEAAGRWIRASAEGALVDGKKGST